MLDIDRRIKDIDKIICENINLIDFDNVTRALISQNLLGQSRNLVEHVAVRIYAGESNIEIDWNNINSAMSYIKQDNKYLFIRQFHSFLQKSKSHYTPDDEGAERLIIKYYQYYLQLRSFVKKEFQLDILDNLEKFPIDTDNITNKYHEEIAKLIEIPREIRTLAHIQRTYVQKVTPFIVDDTVYYEIILTPAYDTVSKFDRFVCYSSILVPSHYSIKADVYYEYIKMHDKKMPVNILTRYEVSIRPCELNNFARLFGDDIKVSASHSEYIGMMTYLTNSGVSLLEIAESTEQEYRRIKSRMFGKSQVHNLENVLDKSRWLILSKKAGANVIRYLLHTLNNKVLKLQWNDKTNWKLSDLYLKWGCIPFDTMPFASSLIQHNPSIEDLLGSVSNDNREHEFLARYIHSNMSVNSRLYTPIKEFEEYDDNVDYNINRFNNNLYIKHCGRRIESFGQNLYVKEAYDQTKYIIEKIQEAAEKGVQGYSDAIKIWLEDNTYIDSEEKRLILQNMFVASHVVLIYGAAGTGKTYIINHISQFWDSHDKLYLTNTNPAIENLRRKINAQNCKFMTIRKFLAPKETNVCYDILVIDECSMVSNSDMEKILRKVNCKLMILVGDTYQIESITFGNWFSMAKYFAPKYAWNELEKPYRTDDKGLLEFWKKVRNLDNDLTEFIVNHRYASNIDLTIFNCMSNDEIILCLNYDGVYGINNINRFLQENNPQKKYRWGLWTFKIGDPILFNESERFMPIIYNNLKGKIVDISLDDNCDSIWFSIEIDKVLTGLDVMNTGLELLDSISQGKSVVKFKVVRKKDSDDDNDYVNDTDIPFQLAYAVSIHKAQGLEYDSVKIIITKEVDELITHNIFYTAITRAKKYLKIYWSPETQEKIISRFEVLNAKRDATIFSAHSKIKKN